MGRYSRKEFVQYLIIYRGTIEETRYYLYLAKSLGYISTEVSEELNQMYNLLGRKINSLITSIRKKDGEKK